MVRSTPLALQSYDYSRAIKVIPKNRFDCIIWFLNNWGHNSLLITTTKQSNSNPCTYLKSPAPMHIYILWNSNWKRSVLFQIMANQINDTGLIISTAICTTKMNFHSTTYVWYREADPLAWTLPELEEWPYGSTCCRQKTRHPDSYINIISISWLIFTWVKSQKYIQTNDTFTPDVNINIVVFWCI